MIPMLPSATGASLTLLSDAARTVLVGGRNMNERETNSFLSNAQMDTFWNLRARPSSNLSPTFSNWPFQVPVCPKDPP
jgi:hypothetical protein